MHKDLPRGVLPRGYLEPSEDTGIPSKLHRDNRQKFLKELIASNPHLESENSVVLFKGAISMNYFESDSNFYPHQEASFMALFGANEADLHALIEIKTGKAIIVAPRVDPAYQVWMVVPDTDYFKSRCDIDDSIYEDELLAYLEKSETTCIYLPYGKNAAYSSATDVANFEWLSKFKIDKSVAYPALIQTRMFKSETELKVLKYAYTYTIEAHKHIMQSVKPGIYENQIEAIFRFEAQSRIGARFLTALPVVSSGKNLCELNYHENDKQIEDNSLVLADMGIKYNGYCADMTFTFPINGKFSTLQRDIYDLIVEGVLLIKESLKPGLDAETIHQKTIELIMKGLEKRGVITNYDPSVDLCILPHLTLIPSGHSETETGHDSRTAEKLKKDSKDADNLTYMWPKLKSSAVITASVGVYFDPSAAAFLAGKINEAKFNQYVKEVGGVRIERQFVITETGAEELAPSPLTADEIEACMRGSQK